MHRAVKPNPHHLGDAARIVAVSLVNLRLQRRSHVPRLDADHWQACFGESTEQPWSSFQPNSLEVAGGVLQHRQQRCRFARHLHFTNDLARVIHNADARLLDRNVQSGKIVHAALLLLMLEAAQRGPRFTISLKRRGPAMYWYGWTATALIGSAILGGLSTMLPENIVRKIPLSLTWVLPVIAVPVLIY